MTPFSNGSQDLTWERVLTASLIGAIIGVVALLANHHIPKALNGGK
jgi:hypothetical protein